MSLLPEDKAKQYWEEHPTDQQLLEKPIPVTLPDKVEMSQGLDEDDKALQITDFIEELPDAQYASMVVRLHGIVVANEKKWKSYSIVTADELKAMKAKYEQFVLAYHRDEIADFRKQYNYDLTRPIWKLLHNYRFPTTNTAAKSKFLQQAVEPYLDLVWRAWDSEKLRKKVDEIKQKVAEAQALQQEYDESLASMPSYLEGLTSAQHLAFHEQAIQVLNKNKKKLTEHYIIFAVDLERTYQPLVKILQKSQGIADSLDANVRKGVDVAFMTLYQALWKFMFCPYDLSYVKECKVMVRKVLDAIGKLKV